MHENVKGRQRCGDVLGLTRKDNVLFNPLVFCEMFKAPAISVFPIRAYEDKANIRKTG